MGRTVCLSWCCRSELWLRAVALAEGGNAKEQIRVREKGMRQIEDREGSHSRYSQIPIDYVTAQPALLPSSSEGSGLRQTKTLFSQRMLGAPEEKCKKKK